MFAICWWRISIINSSFNTLSRWFPNRYLHPRCPPSQYFHHLLQLFRSTHSLLPPHFPWRIIVPSVWLQKHVQYFPRPVNIVLPEGQPCTGENVKSIESWMRGSQPSIYPHLTLLLLMQFLFELCQPAGFCYLIIYTSTGQFKLSCTYKKTRIPLGSSHLTWNQGNISG